jgi:hypothetical protein
VDDQADIIKYNYDNYFKIRQQQHQDNTLHVLNGTRPASSRRLGRQTFKKKTFVLALFGLQVQKSER